MNGKHDTSYREVDGIVWMNKNNNFEFTNCNSKQVNSNFARNLTKMELDKGASSRKENHNDKNVCDYDDSEQSNYEESLSDQDLVLNDEDVWDDSLLIKMYEASQKQINDELIKRFTAKASDIPNEETNHDNVTSVTTKKPKQKTSQKKTTPKASIDTKPALNNLINWKEGDYCQMTYLEDNVDYEAKIISVNSFEQTCLVRYIGYENEETRSLSDLKLSEGERVRKLQIEMAIQDGYGKPESVPEEQMTYLQAQAPELHLPKQLPHVGASQMPGTSRIIPPPPPFLNDNLNNSTPNNQNSLGDDDDVLASMLMSWYMTGYHTGYYQARKDMKNNQ